MNNPKPYTVEDMRELCERNLRNMADWSVNSPAQCAARHAKFTRRGNAKYDHWGCRL